MLEIYKTNISDQPPPSHTDAAVVLISTASNSVKFWLNNLHTNQFVFSSQEQIHKLRVNYSLHILLKNKSPLSFKVQHFFLFTREENPFLFQKRAAPYSIYQRTSSFSSFRALLLFLECEEFEFDLSLPPAIKPSSISPGTKGEKDNGLYVELPFLRS